MDVKESLKNGESLQAALNSIFLSIGNAYYEANKLCTQKANSSQTLALPIAITNETVTKIKQGRASFLDSLDQLEILVTRATEVLEFKAKQRHPDIFRKGSIAALLPQNGHLEDSTNIAIDLTSKAMDPSPESMLLNGEGLLPIVETPLSAPAITDVIHIPDAPLAGSVPEAKVLEKADIPLPPDAIDLSNLNEDILNGTIDFGDFDTSFFEDTNFDFGMMMED
jgi:DNA-binding Xre family transcriptional regulator